MAIKRGFQRYSKGGANNQNLWLHPTIPHMKIVTWNCNGSFRKKYEALFSAYPDADLFIVQECENPDFYNSKAYKEIYATGFHSGTPDYYMKGIGVFSPKGLHLRRVKCKYGNAMMMLGYAPFEVNNSISILAVWPHGKYVEEMIDFIGLNDSLIKENLIIVGDTNSCSVFNYHHPKDKNHDVLVEMLAKKGLADAYNHVTGEEEGKETISTFYLHRHKDKPYHLDRFFIAPNRIRSLHVAEDLDYWLSLSDHIPVVIEID